VSGPVHSISCPLCAKTHSYPLEILTHQMMSQVIGLAVTRTFTLFLTCPEKNLPFQASIQVVDTPSSETLSVKAGPPVQ
jgi:hypothetical protein